MKSEFDRAPAGDGPAAEPLIGVHAWPGAASEYWIGGTAEAPTLAVTVSAQPGPELPGPAEAPEPAARRAAEQAARYGLICSQLDDPRVTVSLLSTLHPGQVLPVADGARSLRRFARAAELFTVTASTAIAPALTGITTLDELLDRYGLPVERLAAANADQPLNRLVDTGQPLAMRTGQIEPDTVPADSSTLAQVAARLRISPERLLEDNRGLRLAAGAAWVLPGTVTLPADARTPYLTQAGDTLTALARRFGTTAQDVVAGNAEVTGVLPAGVHIEVIGEASDEDSSEDTTEDTAEDTSEDTDETVTAHTETVAGDSFQAVHARLAEQHAGVTLDAVAGELARLGTLLEPGVVLSCPLPVLGSDGAGDAGPLTAAEIEAEYGCPPDAFAAANAAVLGVLQPGVQLSAGARTATTAEHDTLNAVLGRLASDGSAQAIAQLLSDNATVPLFRPGARALLPPPPVTVTACPGPAPEPAAPAVPLEVTLRLERAASTGENKPSERADTASPPPRDRDALGDACLTPLPDVRLAADAQDRLWAVWFGSGGISSVRIEHSAGGVLGPRAYALRPPYQRPVDLSAWIRPVTEQGDLGAPALQHFQGVDIEPWARLFLADLDRHLGEPLSDRLPDSARERLRVLRLRLATSIAEGLTPLLDEPGNAPAELLSARAALAGTARSGLMPAYATVIAQCRAVVLSPYGRDGLPAAWLVGDMDVPDRSDISLSASRTELNQSGAWCVFALTATDPSGATSVSFQPQQVYDALELGSPGGTGAGEPVLLRFVRPLAGDHCPATIAAELPPAELPVPLREQPHPVTLQAMTAEATFTGPGRPTLAEATRWTASLTYTHQHATQDLVRLSLAQPAEPPAAATSNLALAEALAGYATAAPELALLLGSDAADPDDADPSRANAAAALVELATAVTTAWSDHWSGQPPAALQAGAHPAGGPLIDSYRLRAVRSTEGGQRLLDRLVVSRDGDNGDWPVITLVSGDEQAALTPGPEIDGAREYVATGRPVAPGPLTVRLAWPGLRGAPRPDARITVTVERNGALRAGTPTSLALVLAARPAQIALVPPCVRWTEELPLTGNSLGQALQNAFDTFAEQLGEQPGGVRLSVEAGYAEPVGELRTVLPVLLVRELVIGPDSARPIADALQAWQRAYQPATAGAQWQLRVAALSAREGEPPLLAFDQLVFPVAAG